MINKKEYINKIKYDDYNRMLYHSGFHPNQRKLFTESELEYICKYFEFDELRTIAFAVGRTEAVITVKIIQLKIKIFMIIIKA